MNKSKESSTNRKDFIFEATVKIVDLQDVFVPNHCSQIEFAKAIDAFWDSLRADYTTKAIQKIRL